MLHVSYRGWNGSNKFIFRKIKVSNATEEPNFRGYCPTKVAVKKEEA